MTKNDHIDFWKNQSIEDLETAMVNFNNKRNTASLFFFHLSIEKILKAQWILDNIGNTPPFTHDLQKLFGETSIPLDRNKYDYLGIINSWNIDTRYPDYRSTLHKLADHEYMSYHIPQLQELHKWLISKV